MELAALRSDKLGPLGVAVVVLQQTEGTEVVHDVVDVGEVAVLEAHELGDRGGAHRDAVEELEVLALELSQDAETDLVVGILLLIGEALSSEAFRMSASNPSENCAGRHQ